MANPRPQSPCLGSCTGTLTLVRVIGKGASAVVYQSRSENGAQYAVKAIRGGQPDRKRRKKALKEITLHTLVSSHPNILSLLDVFSDPLDSDDASPRYTYLVLPYASSGDLYSLILDHKRYLNNASLIQSVFLQVLSAVQHCHSMGVFHRDIKSENILTFDDGRKVMLADFGLATTHMRSREWGIGTITYMSPECLGGPYEPEMGYSPAANDVWSLGILLVNLLTGRNPWCKATATDKSFVEYCRDPCDYLARGLPISWQANAVLRCVFVGEEHRPDVAALIANVAKTQEWYDADAVFEGAMARWRKPEDYVGRDGWVYREPTAEEEQDASVSRFSDDSGYFRDTHAHNESSRTDHVRRSGSGSSDEPATPHPPRAAKPRQLVIRNCASRDVESLDSLPSLTSTSSPSVSPPETPFNVQFSEVQEPMKIAQVKAEVSQLEIQDDPFQWIDKEDARERRLTGHPQRAVPEYLYRSHSQF